MSRRGAGALRIEICQEQTPKELTSTAALKELPRSRAAALYTYLERRVNDGSPSGFLVDLPEPYSPRGEAPYFSLPFYHFPRNCLTEIGLQPFGSEETQGGEAGGLVPVHPLTVNLRKLISKLPANTSIPVVPTASGRTVLCFDDVSGEPTLFVKLHLPIEIGRFVRDLSLPKWLAGLENSKELRSLLPHMPQEFSFLFEGAGIYRESSSGQSGFGAIYRDFRPTPLIQTGRTLLVPVFALFARSGLPDDAPPFLKAVIDLLNSNDPTGCFLDQMVMPLIQSFQSLAARFGLIPEWNAQNVLFELNLDNGSVRLVARDHGDFFKDLAHRDQKGLHTQFSSYKTIDPQIDDDQFERRSFAFDFKLGEYVLRPLCVAFSEAFNRPSDRVLRMVRDRSRSSWRKFRDYFRDDGIWYRYPRKREVSRSVYEAVEDPPFR